MEHGRGEARDRTPATTRAPAARHPALAVLALLLAGVSVVLGVAAHGVRDNRSAAVADQERYAAALAAARTTATAFVNLDYRDPEASFEAVAAGATGEFLAEYEGSTASLVDLLTANQSVMTGEVTAAAVGALDDESAQVLVSTSGEVSNVSSDAKRTARDFRLLLDLVLVDGEWLTDELEIVG